MIVARAYRAAAFTAPGGSTVNLPMDKVDFDSAGGWNLLNGTYVVQKTGKYCVCWRSSIGVIQSDIVVDLGGTGAENSRGDEGQIYGSHGTDIFNLTVGAVVIMSIFTGPNSEPIQTGSINTFVSLAQIV